MRERIDISEVEAQTKIRAKYLRAIENEEWDLLPGPIYAKSFLRTYGDYLGVDSRMLVDEFRRRYEGFSEHDTRPIGSRARRERDRRVPRRRVPAWVPIAVVVLAVLAALYEVGKSGQSNTSTIGKQSRSHHHVAHNAPPKTTTTTTPPPPTKVTLHLVPTSAVYVCLVNGAGTKLINEQTFIPGQAIQTVTARRLLLTLGNAGVRMTVNGKVWPVTASPTAIRFLITPGGVHHIALAQQPTCP